MIFDTVHHIAIICSDYSKAKDFYVNKLGFPVAAETYREARKDWKIDLWINDTTQIELFIVENPPARVTGPEAAGLRHLAFAVEDAEAAAKELNRRGIETEPIRTDTNGKRFTFFKDPDSLPLEIHE